MTDALRVFREWFRPLVNLMMLTEQKCNSSQTHMHTCTRYIDIVCLSTRAQSAVGLTTASYMYQAYTYVVKYN